MEDDFGTLARIQERKRYEHMAYVAPQDRLARVARTAPKVAAVDPDDLPASPYRIVKPAPYTIGNVLWAIAVAYDVELRHIFSRSRAPKFLRSRCAAALMLREKRAMSSARISHALRSHRESSGREWAKIGAKLRATDAEWAALYRAAERALESAK